MSFDVVGLGFSCLDYLGIVPHLPTLDQGARLVDFSRQGGGPVAQALVTLARLGASVGYVGRMGDDEAGELMQRALRDEGLDLSRIQVDQGASSPQAMILIHQPTGKRSICVYRGSVTPIDPNTLDLDYLCSGRFLHLDGASPAAALLAAQEARRRGLKVCLDAGGPSNHLHELLGITDILIASIRFAASYATSGDYRSGAARLLEMGPSVVVVTLGEDGAFTKTIQQEFHTPAFPVPVVDTTGAGDVFHGAFLFGLLQHWDLPMTAQFASATAAIKCLRLGGRAGIPSLPTVIDFLKQRGVTLPPLVS